MVDSHRLGNAREQRARLAHIEDVSAGDEDQPVLDVGVGARAGGRRIVAEAQPAPPQRARGRGHWVPSPLATLTSLPPALVPGAPCPPPPIAARPTPQAR